MSFKVKTTLEQYTTMIDFIDEHKIMVQKPGKQNTDNHFKIVDELWNDLVSILNNSVPGPSKSKQQWRKTFVDWKYLARKKFKGLITSKNISDITEVDTSSLTSNEEKFLSVLLTVQGVEAVLDPFKDPLDFRPDDTENDEDEDLDENCVETIFIREETEEATQIENEVVTKREPIKTNIKRTIQEVHEENSEDTKKRRTEVKVEVSPPGSQQVFQVVIPDVKKKELELKEKELDIRLMEAKNKQEELRLKRIELDLKKVELDLKRIELGLSK